MAPAQMIEGTTEEITRQLQQSYAGRKLPVFVEPEAEKADLAANLPDPPLAIRSREHLTELLLEGVNSPTHEVTEATWERLHERVSNQPHPSKR